MIARIRTALAAWVARHIVAVDPAPTLRADHVCGIGR